MAANGTKINGGGHQPQWPGYLQFLCVLALTMMFALLAFSMKRHHYLDGSLDHRNQASRR